MYSRVWKGAKNLNNIEFSWFAPTSGDYEYVNSPEPMVPPSIDYIVKIAKKAESAGFNDILIPIDPRCMDPIVTASYILQETNKLNTLIAYRPGITSPQTLATMLSTLDNNKNRVKLNVVQGTPKDALMQGYRFPEPEKKAMHLQSFSRALKKLLSSEGKHAHRDDFFEYEKATVNPSFSRPPKMFIGGGLPAMKIASELYDYYLTFGDTVEKISEYVIAAKKYSEDNFNRKIKFGMGINIVARESKEEAYNDCLKLLHGVTDEQLKEMEKLYKKRKALGNRDYMDLVKKDFILEENLWLGLAQVRFGPVATIYGSYEEVANKIMDYQSVGIDYFSLTGYPYMEEVENVGKVIELIKVSVTS